MPKIKEIMKETIIPIIKLLIILIPPLIPHLYLVMWAYQVSLAEALFTLFPIWSIFFPYYYVFLLIWIIILAKTKILSG